mgnify:CR=1 FL=1
MNQEITILQLYPDELNIYGDNGNLLALKKRLEWRGIIPNIILHNISDDFSNYQPDIILAGGGQESNLLKINDDLQKITPLLTKWIESGVSALFICGAYQFLGKVNQTTTKQILPATGMFNFETISEQERLVGNIVLKSSEFGEVVGYENHSGRTYLGKGLQPFGRVVKGRGNNGRDHSEGLRYKNLIATYLHGPILPKNPLVADFLIRKALQRRYGNDQLAPLEDTIELSAQKQSASRPK